MPGQPAIYVHPLEDKKHPILDGKKWVPLLEDKKQPILDGDKYIPISEDKKHGQ